MNTKSILLAVTALASFSTATFATELTISKFPSATPTLQLLQPTAESLPAPTTSTTPPIAAVSSVGGKTYYVDFSAGNDGFSGTTAATPWKHAPGDLAATGLPAAAILQPGDIVRFKGTVPYRGTIKARFDGTLANPITYTGAGFGSGAAIIDGANPVTSVIKCPSAQACGNSPAWPSLSLVTYTPTATGLVKFYDPVGLLYEAQSPAPVDAFYSDELANYAISSLADKAMIESGRLRDPEIIKLLNGVPKGTLQFWVAGNEVVRRDITGIDSDTVLFSPDGLRLYSDRPGRYSLIGHPGSIAAPGQYAVLAPGKAVVWTRRTTGLLIGDGRGGFDISDRSGITISNFIFRHQTSAKTDSRKGFAITHRIGKMSTGIVITSNRFERSALWNDMGAIEMHSVDNARISDNRFSMIERGSGMRLGTQNTRYTVSGNYIDTVGRTGIMFMRLEDSLITRNYISNLKGIHGNGISVYLDNRRITVSNNRVVNTERAMTFHGDKTTLKPGDNDLLIERNIFVGIPTTQASLTSWGANTRGVTIRNNAIIGGRHGLILSSSDTGINVSHNYITSITLPKIHGANWTFTSNVIAPKTFQYIAGDALNHAEMCAGAAIPRGTSLGNIPC